MNNPTMNDIKKLLRNSKYVVATTSLWKDDKKCAKDVALMGFSKKVDKDKCFKTWNTGFNNFYYGIRVIDGKVVDESGRVLEITFLSDSSTKTINERIKAKREFYGN